MALYITDMDENVDHWMRGPSDGWINVGSLIKPFQFEWVDTIVWFWVIQVIDALAFLILFFYRPLLFIVINRLYLTMFDW